MNLAEIKALSVFDLAQMAECASPDDHDSPGAKLLDSVRDDFIEKVEYNEGDNVNSDQWSEIADTAPDVYTSTRWAEFVDLAAYQEEPELGEWPSDLTEAAGVALYQIAYRLAAKLSDEYAPDESDDE